VTEEAIPGQGTSEAKPAAVRGVLEVANAEIEDLWPITTKVIEVMVSTFNKVGWGHPQSCLTLVSMSALSEYPDKGIQERSFIGAYEKSVPKGEPARLSFFICL
jgi:hypothetical protein